MAAVSEWRVKLVGRPKDVSCPSVVKTQVIDTGLCCRCMACMAACPAAVRTGVGFDFEERKHVCVDCEICVRICPRLDYKPLSGIGSYIKAVAGRSKRFKGQDGAMVTEILMSAMEMGIIDRCIFVGRDEDWRTEILHVRDVEQLEVPTLTGTKYTFAAAVPALREAVLNTKVGVGFVGTPCMVSGVRRLQKELAVFRRKVKLVIGLFCTENFYWDELTEFLKERGVDIKKLVKTDITKGKFIATMTDDVVEFPVKELSAIMPSGCRVCTDFSAVESDVSVGSVGSKPGFSTVLVREENAKEVLDFIREHGYADFDEVSLEFVERLCNLKKKREANIK